MKEINPLIRPSPLSSLSWSTDFHGHGHQHHRYFYHDGRHHVFHHRQEIHLEVDFLQVDQVTLVENRFWKSPAMWFQITKKFIDKIVIVTMILMYSGNLLPCESKLFLCHRHNCHRHDDVDVLRMKIILMMINIIVIRWVSLK